MADINLPVGNSNFADIIENNYYYVDKTGLIEEILRDRGIQVTLITRPRHFGKTLAMTMLAEIFDITKNSKSVFDGLNIAKNSELMEKWLNKYFGFTQNEVDKILTESKLEFAAGDIKKWYDGYHFGETDVYCPWNVMNYVNSLQNNPKAKPVGYWKNSSDNMIIRSFIDSAKGTITGKIETLLSGGNIIENINEDLTYQNLHESEDNLWSILYLTGYLTLEKKKRTLGYLKMVLA